MKTLTGILKYFGKQPKSFLITFNLLIVIVTGVIDYITGYEIGLSSGTRRSQTVERIAAHLCILQENTRRQGLLESNRIIYQ